MALNLGTILASSARERPGHPLIRLNEQSWSYAEVDRAARGIASSLIERGLGPGDKVALLVPNVPEFTQAYFGILYAGCTVVPLNVLLSAPEVTYHVQDSEAKLLIAHPLFSNPATKGAEGAGVPLVWAGGEVPGAPSLVELAEALLFFSGRPEITDEIRGMLERAVAADPGIEKGLWLLGFAAAQSGDDEQAIAFWQRLVQQMEPASDAASAVQEQISQARVRLGIEPGADWPGIRI